MPTFFILRETSSAVLHCIVLLQNDQYNNFVIILFLICPPYMQNYKYYNISFYEIYMLKRKENMLDFDSYHLKYNAF